MRSKFTEYFLKGLIHVLIAGIFVFDIYTPNGLAVGILYLLSVFFTAFISNKFYTIVTAIYAIVLIILGYLISDTAVAEWIALTNRIFSIAGIIIATYMVLYFKLKAEASAINEQSFKALFLYAAEGIVVVDQKGKIKMANPRAEELFGYKAAELENKQLEILVPNRFKSKHEQHRDNFKKNPHSRAMGQGLDLYARRKDGSEFPVEISLSFIKNQQETLSVAFVTDVTVRKQTEKALQDERNFINAILNTVGAIIMVMDPNGKIIRLNKEGEKLSSYSESEVIGKHPWDLFLASGDVEETLQQFKGMRAGELVPLYESVWITKNGEKKNISWSNTSLVDEQGKLQYVISTGIEITQQKKLERELFNALVEGQEQERKRLARELHDGLGPLLSSVKNNLEAIESSIELKDANKRKFFENSMFLLNESMNEVRSMAKNLMPKVLEELGLTPALKDLCNRVEESHDFTINFYSNFQAKFSPSLNINLYRISQELLNNIIKHANASRVSVQLIHHENSLVLMFEDNGTGYNYKMRLNNGSGLGLKNIESRVKSLNGIITVDSFIGKGTITTIEIPVED